MSGLRSYARQPNVPQVQLPNEPEVTGYPSIRRFQRKEHFSEQETG
jgi:hypothetical protein